MSIEFDESTGKIEIEYTMIVAIAQFENMKPLIRLKCDPAFVEQAMDKCRELLRNEYTKIKQKGNGNENKN